MTGPLSTGRGRTGPVPAGPVPAGPVPTGADHVGLLYGPLRALAAESDRLDRWGAVLGDVLLDGGRVLVAGNGGSAAQAQHLAAELVGRYRDDRRALAAIALCADSASVTAIGNDYGYDEVFARQVRAHGRQGDVLVCLSTSGRSPNVVRAARAGVHEGLTVWSLTGPAPNPLIDASDDALIVAAGATATIQEVHQVAIHMLCAVVEHVIGSAFRQAPLRASADRANGEGRTVRGER